jgi:hypothetical protein
MLVLPTLLATTTQLEHERMLGQEAVRRSLSAAARCCRATLVSRIQAALRRSPGASGACA